jgi:glycosyltransferase involved in cell wall biosynthesis
MRTLIFFTSQFPFGSGETFVENEFPFLAAAFDRIFIISNKTDGPQTRSIPPAIDIIRIPYSSSFPYKAAALAHIFSPVILNELNFIRQKLNLPLNRQILSALFTSYAKAFETASFINRLIVDYKIELNGALFYSYWMNDIAAGIALFKSRNKQAKAICRAHGWDVYFERHQPPYLPLRNFIVQHLNACYCISENGQAYIKNLCSFSNVENVRLSRLGTLNQQGLRSTANGNKLTIVSCSGIIALKRINLIIDSLALLKGFDVEWIHFGSGMLEKSMQTLAAEKLSSLQHVKYRFAGQFSNPELLAWYAVNSIDLFINVSTTEGLPVSMMEAGSFGIPVIATNVGGVSEIIEHGQNGFLVPGNAIAAQVAEQIEFFYHLQQVQKEKMRQCAIEKWDSKFNAQKNYGNFINSILSL